MLIRAATKALNQLRKTRINTFSQKKGNIPSYLNQQQIKDTVTPEEYSSLQNMVEEKESELLQYHQERMLKVSAELREEDRTRIGKIASLLQSLNEQQAEYVKYKLMSNVQIEKLE